MRLQGYLPLTQFGQDSPQSAEPFKDRLGPEETEMSLIVGKVDAAAASMLVRRYVVRDALRRVTTVSKLRAGGFRVDYTPAEGNHLHVSVYAPDGAEWDGEVADKFGACFTDVEGMEEVRGQ